MIKTKEIVETYRVSGEKDKNFEFVYVNGELSYIHFFGERHESFRLDGALYEEIKTIEKDIFK